MNVAEDRLPPGARVFECELNDEFNYKDRLVASTNGAGTRVYLEAQRGYANQTQFTAVCVSLSREDQIALRDWLSERING